jgi:para-aminobenzoate synthetase/4-amino-4-deoxychorismate lyase
MDSLRKIVLRDAATSEWRVFEQPVRVLSTRRLEDVIAILEEIDDAVEQDGLTAAGFLCYEAAPAFDDALCVKPDCSLPLVCFALYDDVTVLPALPEPLSRARLEGPWQHETDPAAYADRIARIRDEIECGNCYQVNYSIRQTTSTTRNPWDLFLSLADDSPLEAFVDSGDFAIVSCSPELFFSLEGDRIVTRPMKGTAKRGMTSALDAAAQEALANSAKNRAENIMITDMLRSDLGKVAASGSVRASRLLDVEKYPTVWQMTSTVEATTRATLTEIMRALFPCASITGAPKAATMRLIAELEDSPRAIYTGSIGFYGPGRRAQFNVAIRTLLIDAKTNTATYGTGGGIVWDSLVADEYDECRAKTEVLKTRPQDDDFSLLETILWTRADGYFLLDEHLDRLWSSANYFGFDCDAAGARRALATAADTFVAKRYRVRLLLDRHGDIQIEHLALGDSNGRGPVRLRLARRPVDDRNPFLYHKTTRRDVYDKARAEAGDCDDVVLYNEQGLVTETCIANVLIERSGRRVTPPVSCGLLGGTYRTHLLERGELSEEKIRVSELAPRQSIILINSVRGEYPAVLVG